MPNLDYITLMGQFIGFASILLGFLNYQIKSPRQIIVVQLATRAVFCAHYLLIDAISAFTLNAV